MRSSWLARGVSPNIPKLFILQVRACRVLCAVVVIYGHNSQKGLVYATIKLLPATTSCPFGKDEVLKGLMRLFRALTSYKVLKGKAFKGLKALEDL